MRMNSLIDLSNQEDHWNIQLTASTFLQYFKIFLLFNMMSTDLE